MEVGKLIHLPDFSFSSSLGFLLELGVRVGKPDRIAVAAPRGSQKGNARSGKPGGLEWFGYLARAMANKHPLISPAIRAKMETARVARLATLDAERGPHIVPICFACDGSVFYSAIDRKPKRTAPSRLVRLKNIKETPQVALLVDQYDEDWTHLWFVLVRGEAELIAAPAERKRAIQRLREKYEQYDADMLPDDAPILRITPLRITTWGAI